MESDERLHGDMRAAHEQLTGSYYQNYDGGSHFSDTIAPTADDKLCKSPSPPNSSAATASSQTASPTSEENSAGKEGSSHRSHLQPPTHLQHSAVYQDLTSSATGSQPSNNNSQRYNPADYPCAIKLLVSNNVAGSIIGRQGQTINELQSQSGTRIKLSQAGDYYPGTQDRVCLVQGETESVKLALQLLLSRLYRLQEQHRESSGQWQEASDQSFDFVVRLLVPFACSGMLIGKSGSNIKFMEDKTGVTSVRLSSKDNTATAERVVTITGPAMENCMKCSSLILNDMMNHSDVSRYANLTTSYARILEVNSNLYAAPPMHIPNGPRRVMMHQYSPQVARPEPMGPGLWEGFPPIGREAGGDNSVRRVVSSPEIPPLGMPHQSSFHPPTSENGTLMPSMYMIPPPSQEDMSLPVTQSTSEPDLLALQMEQSLQLSGGPLPPGGPTADYGLATQTPTMISPGCFESQVLVPDNMVGSILGRAGRTLNELQMMSGTRIRISQRGEYMPGTRSRIITVQGPNAQCVWQAQYMMSQRIVLPQTAAYAVPQTGQHQPQSFSTEHPPQS